MTDNDRVFVLVTQHYSGDTDTHLYRTLESAQQMAFQYMLDCWPEDDLPLPTTFQEADRRWTDCDFQGEFAEWDIREMEIND